MDWDYDPSETFFPVTSVRWYTDSQILMSTGDGYIKLYNILETDPKRKLRSSISFKGKGINALDIDPDKIHFASGGMEHTLRIHDFSNMQEVVSYQAEDSKHNEHFNRIFSIKFDPSNPNIVYSGGWDKSILVHDIRKKHSVRSFMGPYVAGDTLDI